MKTYNISINMGDILTHTELMNLFKCGNCGGMRRSHETKSLVLISNKSKGIYVNEWIGDIFYFTGMGKNGDQVLGGYQNLTLANSKDLDITVYLFEVIDKGLFTYRGIVELISEPYLDMQFDENKTLRKVYIFPLKIINKQYTSMNNIIEDEIIESRIIHPNISKNNIKKNELHKSIKNQIEYIPYIYAEAAAIVALENINVRKEEHLRDRRERYFYMEELYDTHVDINQILLYFKIEKAIYYNVKKQNIEMNDTDSRICELIDEAVLDSDLHSESDIVQSITVRIKNICVNIIKKISNLSSLYLERNNESNIHEILDFITNLNFNDDEYSMTEKLLELLHNRYHGNTGHLLWLSYYLNLISENNSNKNYDDNGKYLIDDRLLEYLFNKFIKNTNRKLQYQVELVIQMK